MWTVILSILHGNGWMRALHIHRASGNKINRGSLYVALGRMEECGYVYRRVRSDGRSEYHITERGIWLISDTGWKARIIRFMT